MRRDTLGVLEDIRDGVEFIEVDVAGATFESCLADRRTRPLVTHNFLIIGEAVNRLRHHDPAIAARISGHDEIVDFRYALIHGYDVIDYPTVWMADQVSLPVLKAEVARLLGEFGGSGL